MALTVMIVFVPGDSDDVLRPSTCAIATLPSPILRVIISRRDCSSAVANTFQFLFSLTLPPGLVTLIADVALQGQMPSQRLPIVCVPPAFQMLLLFRREACMIKNHSGLGAFL